MQSFVSYTNAKICLSLATILFRKLKSKCLKCTNQQPLALDFICSFTDDFRSVAIVKKGYITFHIPKQIIKKPQFSIKKKGLTNMLK